MYLYYVDKFPSNINFLVVYTFTTKNIILDSDVNPVQACISFYMNCSGLGSTLLSLFRCSLTYFATVTFPCRLLLYLVYDFNCLFLDLFLITCFAKLFAASHPVKPSFSFLIP